MLVCAASRLAGSEASSTIVIRSFNDGVAGVRTQNPEMRLTVGRDPLSDDEPVLFVDYPQATADPAGRDVWCDAENTNWTAGKTIVFRARSAARQKISVSFLDRNSVAYTTWIDLRGSEWQDVRISLESIRPNPYFQPPGAKKGLPIDVSEVKAIGFAPQDPAPGQLAVGRIELVE